MFRQINVQVRRREAPDSTVTGDKGSQSTHQTQVTLSLMRTTYRALTLEGYLSCGRHGDRPDE